MIPKNNPGIPSVFFKKEHELLQETFPLRRASGKASRETSRRNHKETSEGTPDLGKHLEELLCKLLIGTFGVNPGKN